MKKLINEPSRMVEEMLEGIAIASPTLKLLKGANVIVRHDCTQPDVKCKVALISGGGTGHEPAHAGYVGKGMLSAAVCGNVFSSPNPSQVLAAIRAVTGPAGVLLIVKCYTGDRLNFGIAAEMARAEGYLVEMIIVGDDCALIGESENAGRRGLAGTVLVHKVAGAAAESGISLQEVTRIARNIASRLALSSCNIPGAAASSFEIGEKEVELGLGIHGEKGFKRVPLKPVSELVDQVLDLIIQKSPPFLATPAPKHIVLLINNLGVTTPMEIAIATKRAVSYLESKGFLVERVYAGPFMTALDMAGFSITLLPVSGFDMPLLDLPTNAPGWPNVTAGRPHGTTHFEMEQIHPHKDSHSHGAADSQLPLAQHDLISTFICQLISTAANTLIVNKNFLNDLDLQVGDGDIGTSLEKAAHKVLVDLPALTFHNPPSGFKALAHILQSHMGGTSGPLYSVFFLRMASKLDEEHKAGKDYHDSKVWAAGLTAGVKGIMDLGDAKAGDRTMLDALIPGIEAIQKAAETSSDFSSIIIAADEAARQGTEATKELVARRGRTSYLGDRAKGVVDPGAKAISLIFQSFVQVKQ